MEIAINQDSSSRRFQQAEISPYFRKNCWLGYAIAQCGAWTLFAFTVSKIAAVLFPMLFSVFANVMNVELAVSLLCGTVNLFAAGFALYKIALIVKETLEKRKFC